MKYKVLCLILIFLGLLFLINFRLDITGAAIGGYELYSEFGSSIGLLLILMSIILLLTEESELERKIEKLFIKDPKTREIIVTDFLYLFGGELGHTVVSRKAKEVLDELKNKLGKDKITKKIAQEDLENSSYFKIAYSQRDICESLEPETEGYYADRFLFEWDLNYKSFVPSKNPYLIYKDEQKLVKLEDKEIYDTRDVLSIMKHNIEGFKIIDKKIGQHDVLIEYRGARFHIMAGSKKPYELPKKNIIRVLKRIIIEDIKKKNIEEGDQKRRLDILRNYLFY